MEITVDYAYYSGPTYGGTLNKADFTQVLSKAQDRLNELITGEIIEISVTLQKALCYMIDLTYATLHSADAQSGITSEHLGDYSYSKDAAVVAKRNGELRSTIINLLAREGLYQASVCSHY
jgi:hypothetical protein